MPFYLKPGAGGPYVPEVKAALVSAGFKDCSVSIADNFRTSVHGHYLISNLKWDAASIAAHVDNAPDPNATGLEGKCPICYDDNVKLMALTPCGHTICTGCAGDFVGKECPHCRQMVSGVQGVFPS